MESAHTLSVRSRLLPFCRGRGSLIRDHFELHGLAASLAYGDRLALVFVGLQELRVLIGAPIHLFEGKQLVVSRRDPFEAEMAELVRGSRFEEVELLTMRIGGEQNHGAPGGLRVLLLNGALHLPAIRGDLNIQRTGSSMCQVEPRIESVRIAYANGFHVEVLR